jgi:hypothetical protein
MKRTIAGPREVFGQLGNARFVFDRRVRVGGAGRRFGWIFASSAVNMI